MKENQKSHDDLEAKQNEERVKEHLMAKEIKKIMEGTKNVREDEVGNSIHNSQNDLDTRDKGKNVEESKHTASPITIRYHRIHYTLISSDTEKLQELMTRFLARKKLNVLAQHLQEVMEEALPKMVDDHDNELTKTQVPLYVAKGLIMERK
uniref:Uncharacterized protein n=1 Tax=Tanacetum cinerariifolium TaxID=118510 RepID=A0A699K0A0_TANCI|nr:hypothetical protein [Tanacetum cinerariifolium]